MVEIQGERRGWRMFSLEWRLGALMPLFYCSDINAFWIDYTQSQLCNIWLLLVVDNSRCIAILQICKDTTFEKITNHLNMNNVANVSSHLPVFNWNLIKQISCKMIYSKTVFKEFANTLRASPIYCFWHYICRFKKSACFRVCLQNLS